MTRHARGVRAKQILARKRSARAKNDQVDIDLLSHTQNFFIDSAETNNVLNAKIWKACALG